MACINSITKAKILEMTKNEEEATRIYNYLSSDEFRSKFGDWTNSEVNVDPSGFRTTEQGEPKLFMEEKRDGKKLYFFLDANKNRIDITKRTMEYVNIEDRTSKINEVVNTISHSIFEENIKNNFNNLESIDRIDIMSYIESFIEEQKEIIDQFDSYYNQVKETHTKEEIDNYLGEGVFEIKKIQNELKDNFLSGIENNKEEIKIKINEFFRSKGLTINEVIEEEEEEDNSDRGEKENSVEQNTKDKASANVKLMLSFLPYYELSKPYNKNDNDSGFNMATGEGRFTKKTTGMFESDKLMQGDVVHEELLKELSNLVAKETTEGSTDVYHRMRDIMLSKSHDKPHYKDLVNLLDSVDEQKRTEFHAAMMHFQNNHLISEIDIKKGSFKTFNAAKQTTIESKIIRNWEQAFDRKFRVKGKIEKSMVDKAITAIQNTIKNHNAISSSMKGNINEISDERFSSNLSRMISGSKYGTVNMLKALGLVNIDQNIIYSIISRTNNEPESDLYRSELVANLNRLNTNISRSLKNLNSRRDSKDYNFITDNRSRLFNVLAETTAIYQNDVKDSTVYSMGKMFWVYSNPSFLSNKVNLYKQNPNKLKELKKYVYNGSSLYIDYLLAEEVDEDGNYIYVSEDRKRVSRNRLDKFELNRMLEFQEKDNSKDGTDNKKISVVDQTIDRINKVMLASITDVNGELTKEFDPIYASIVPADKATSFEIKIGQFINETLSESENDNMVFSEEVLDIFYNYFLDEYNRMIHSFKQIKEFESLSEEEKAKQYNKLKIHYHVNPKLVDLNSGQYGIRDKQGRLVGQSFKSQIFSEIDYTSMEKLIPGSNMFNELNEPVFEEGLNDEIHKTAIKDLINTMMGERIKENFDILKDQRIIQEDGSMFTTDVIDSRVKKSYGAQNGKFTKSSVYNLISDYSLNTVIANVEYTKLFTGDPAYYKNMVDFFKRVPATYTDGIPLRLGMTEGDAYFNMSVVENQIVGSKVYKELENSLKLVNKDITEEEINDIIGAYKGSINQTDAQAWITPHRWRFILDRAGKWTSKHDVVFDKMLGKNTDAFTADELKLSAQPLKGVYFSNGIEGPIYMKYSQAVLSPILVKGTGLESMYNAMTKDNNGSDLDFKDQIHEVVTLDGVKVGANVPVKITGDTVGSNRQVLNNYDYKIQQDLPVKLMKQTLLGSQIQKNIYSTVKNDSVYEIAGNRYVGQESVEFINQLLSIKSNNGIESLDLLFGKDNNNVIDIESMYEIIEDEILSNPDQYTENIKDAVAKKIPFEAMPSLKNKLYSILFSKIRKAASNTKTNGGSFIQMSNYGLDQQTADEVGVTWLVDKKDLEKPSFEQQGLKPPTLYVDENGTIKQRPGQIFISHSDIAKLIPNYRELAKEGKLKDMLDQDILKAIGYRIPNQGMSSNDALEIVGILPPHMNDTVVAYTEITTKTGSDFDIDKMYIMLPEIKASYSKENFNKGFSYARKNNLQKKDYIDALTQLEDNIGMPIYTEEQLSQETPKDLAEMFIEDILLDKDLESDYRDEFLKEYSIGSVSRITKVPSGIVGDKALNNMLFDSYWAILTHKDTYTDLIKPIDFDYLENHIKSLNKTEDVNENFRFYDGIYQLKLKNTYILGKSGVGIAANMAVDHNISKNGVQLRFNEYYLGIGFRENLDTVFDVNPETGTSFSEELTDEQARQAAARTKESTGKDVDYRTLRSFKIGDTISALMNAFVDNAKDPYIEKGNYNTYTSDTAFMMVRAGVHPYYINNFLGQPILKKLSAFVNNHESISIKPDSKYKGMSAYDIILQEEVENLMPDINQKEIREQIRKFKRQGVDTPSYDTLLDNYNNIENNRFNIEMLLKFKEFQDKAKKLTASVNLSRFDTLGSGKNYIDMMVYQNNLIEFFNKEGGIGELMGHLDKYVRNGKLTSLGTNLKNSVFYSSNIIDANEKLFLSANKYIRATINNITMNTASSYGKSMGRATDADLISSISKDIYTSIMSKFPLFQIEGSRKDFINNTKDKLIELKREMQKDDIKSPFIEALTFYDNSFGIDIGNIPVNMKNNISDSFYDLYKTDFELALDVIKSSFFMNGFNQSIIDFNEFIPHEFFINFHKVSNNEYLSVQEFVNQQLSSLVNANYMASFHKEYAQNNFDSNVIVPTINEDYLRYSGVPNSEYISNKNIRNRYMLNYNEDISGKPDYSTASYSRYIKNTPSTKKLQFDPMYTSKSKLLEYKGNVLIGEDWFPIYQEIEKKGFKDKKSRLELKEYGVERTAFPANKLMDRSNREFDYSRFAAFIHHGDTIGYNSDKMIKNTDQLEEFIFNNDRNESVEVVESEENIVSLQEDKFDYNPTNVSEEKRLEYKQYVIDNLGMPNVEFETKANIFYFEDDTVIYVNNNGNLFLPEVTESIVELSEKDSNYDIKFTIGLNKIAEEKDISLQEDNENPLDCN